MSDSEPEFDPDRTEVLQGILDLLASAGYSRARIPSVSPFDKLTGGLAWCIAATHAVDAEFHALCDEDLTVCDKIKVGEVIEATLRSMKCPYPLQAHQIQGLDYKGAYPVVQWVVARVLKVQAEMEDENQMPLFQYDSISCGCCEVYLQLLGNKALRKGRGSCYSLRH